MITWKVTLSNQELNIILFFTDKQKVLYSALVCTMIFSTAEAPPVSVYGKCIVLCYVYLMFCLCVCFRSI